MRTAMSPAARMSARAASSRRCAARRRPRARSSIAPLCARARLARGELLQRRLRGVEVALVGQRRDEDAGGDRAIELRRREVGGLEHRARVAGRALQVAAAQQQPRAPGHARGEERAVADGAALDQPGLDRPDGLVEGVGPHERDRCLDEPRQVGRRRHRPRAGGERAPRQRDPDLGRLVARRRRAWRPRRAPRAWPAARRRGGAAPSGARRAPAPCRRRACPPSAPASPAARRSARRRCAAAPPCGRRRPPRPRCARRDRGRARGRASRRAPRRGRRRRRRAPRADGSRPPPARPWSRRCPARAAAPGVPARAAARPARGAGAPRRTRARRVARPCGPRRPGAARSRRRRQARWPADARRRAPRRPGRRP